PDPGTQAPVSMILPTPFKDQMKALLGAELSDFETAMNAKPPVSVRINPFKSEHSLPLAGPVPWCKDAFYLTERPIFTVDPFFHAGHYYVQEASSMYLDSILKQLNISKAATVLDLCAAPGGKSTLIQSHLSEGGLMHSHEFDPHRASVLKQNLERWGQANTLITKGRLDQLPFSTMRYDLILIDAPCSGEGMFRKEPAALRQWSPKKVQQCTAMQKSILETAHQLCKPNGYIIYSTCTYNTLENEQIVQALLSSQKYQGIHLTDDLNWIRSHQLDCTYRFYPHRTAGEGFTFSVIQKQDKSLHETADFKKSNTLLKTVSMDLTGWIEDPSDYSTTAHQDQLLAFPTRHMESVQWLHQSGIKVQGGIPIGTFKGKDFFPAHGLALSIHLHSSIARQQLDEKEALDYLRALSPITESDIRTTWFVAAYRSARLGWLKRAGHQIKNYFPKNQRIISY
ncbi:MAG TPA: methyltransferase domain-containing protein, partial [Saprospiraceae bacterium]|nr:methyltransferase domain-containing protein [Saprospiraceae bacterium]